MRTLLTLSVFTAFLFFSVSEFSHSRCFQSGPDMFVCDSAQPNPDPDGIQQGGNDNGVKVDVFPDGNIDTGNFIAIHLGNGENIIDINGSRIEAPGRAVNTGMGDDRMTVRRSELIGDGFTIELLDGDDFLEISDTIVRGEPGGFTINFSEGNDTLIMDRCEVTGGPDQRFIINGSDDMDNFTIRNSRIHSDFVGSFSNAISMGSEDDKLYIEDSVITTADNVFPVRLGDDNDELTLAGFGSTIPGGIGCGIDFDTIIFSLVVPEKLIEEITERIENAPTPDGSISINGFLYEYDNCELLVADLRSSDPRPIPTLSEWGLIGMAGLIGIIGLLTIRRKKAAA